MTGLVLDTNVVSEMRRLQPDRNVLAFIDAQPLESLFISTVTLAELRFGIERVGDAALREQLAGWLAHRVRPMFGQRVLPVSEDVLLRWRNMVDEGRRSGITFPQPDLFIAATASLHGMTVVTRDASGFARTRVPVINPWEPQS